MGDGQLAYEMGERQKVNKRTCYQLFQARGSKWGLLLFGDFDRFQGRKFPIVVILWPEIESVKNGRRFKCLDTFLQMFWMEIWISNRLPILFPPSRKVL